MNKIRIDKYLWAIRLFKTRSLATKACTAGKVKIDGQSVKASYQIKIGDILKVRKNNQVTTIKVTDLIEKRVGATLAVNYYEDITPEEDKVTIHRSAFISNERRDRGTGRPTKKDRRNLKEFKDEDFTEWENF